MVSHLIDPRIKLRHITCFLEVVRLGGVVQAANALGMSQPAVSKAIIELDRVMGHDLFDRSRRKMELTEHGELFLGYASAAVGALKQGMERVEAANHRESFVSFGALPSVEALIVPMAVAAFSASAMRSRVHVESGPSAYLLNLVRAAEIEFFVGRMPKPELMSGLVFEQLYAEEVVFVVRPEHPVLENETIEFGAIEHYQVIMPPKDAVIRPVVEQLMLANTVSLMPNQLEAVSNSFGRAYCLLTDAIWVVSRSVIESDVKLNQLIALPFDMRVSQGPVGIVTQAGVELSVLAIQMIKHIRDVVEKSQIDS